MPHSTEGIEPMKPITASNALYIKLGPKGSWEKECIENGILRFGDDQIPLEAASNGLWTEVRQCMLNQIQGKLATATDDEMRIRQQRRINQVATSYVKQTRHFFEAGDNTLWITFYGGFLWWCFATGNALPHEDGQGIYRLCRDGRWQCEDIRRAKLSRDKLSGKLLKVEMFMGGICNVIEFEYLRRKLNAQLLPQVDVALKTANQMVEKIAPLMRLLTWQDFELLVDLVFSNSGWKRVGQVGDTQKTLDIDIILPTTGERAFVQIKSKATKEDLESYLEQLKEMRAYKRMFFVWHTGDIGETDEKDISHITEHGEKIISLIGPIRLARLVFDAGLASWLIKKAS